MNYWGYSLNSRVIVELLGVFVKQPSSDNTPYEKIGDEVRSLADEVPFDIPDSWEWVRLGNILSYAETKQKVNATSAYPSIWGLELEDIEKGGRLLEHKTVGERKAVGDKTVFTKGDILYSKLRPYLLKILVAPDDGICPPEIVPFRVYGGINPNYIVNYLKSPYVDNLINSITYGVKMPRVGTENNDLSVSAKSLRWRSSGVSLRRLKRLILLFLHTMWRTKKTTP